MHQTSEQGRAGDHHATAVTGFHGKRLPAPVAVGVLALERDLQVRADEIDLRAGTRSLVHDPVGLHERGGRVQRYGSCQREADLLLGELGSVGGGKARVTAVGELGDQWIDEVQLALRRGGSGS
jgi:hypothetical protein